MTRRFVLLMADVVLMVLATIVALELRHNFEVSEVKLLDFLPYLGFTALTCIIICPLMGLDRAVWRFSDVPDYVRASGAVTLVVASTVAITFAYNRLEGVSRSMPVLQELAGTAFFIGARYVHRARHGARLRKKLAAPILRSTESFPAINVFLIGVTRLAEIYMQAAAELAPGRVKVAGLAGRTGRHTGRLVGTHPVLGTPEEIERILDDLEVHGIAVDRIVVAGALETLSKEARDALDRVERARPVVIQVMARDFGFCESQDERNSQGKSGENSRRSDIGFEISSPDLEIFSRRAFWKVKRIADASIAFALLLVASPIMGVVALFVASGVGFPLMFWQQRPGLGGRPFRIYKFRTMLGPFGPGGRLLAEAERASEIGRVLRRTRLDELPQLFNILRGDMSFIGPRPLLPRDQSEAYRARLLVRPGLTGWAQVVGGRDISAADKAALDVWYVRNASVILDLKIVLKTIPLILFGERISRPLIDRAWRDLSEAGVLKGDMAISFKNRLCAAP